MQRPTSTAVTKKGEWVCPDADFLSVYPTLAQGMSDRWWDDGKPRDPWTITIAFMPDSVQLSLTDKGLCQSLFTNADSVTEGLVALEAIVSGGASSWRRWRSK
jgi:hypothetical protein